MRSAFAVTLRILRQYKHDPRTIFMMIFAPIIALAILNIIFGSPDYEPLILHDGLAAGQVSAIEEAGAELEQATESDALAALDNAEADAFVRPDGTRLKIWLEGTDPAKSGSVLKAVVESAPKELRPPEPDIVYVHGSEDRPGVDFYGPVFIGVFVFFFVFITSGISFVRERTGGTLERLMATPIKRWELVVGYVQGFGLFSLLQTVIVAWASIYWVGFSNAGEFWLVLVIAESMALVSLTLGILVSEFANTELQVMQLMQIIVIPQILLSGMFDLSQTPQWMQTLSRAFPLTYGAEAMRAVMLSGEGFDGVFPQLALLWAFALVFCAGNVVTLKKYRRL